MRLFLTGLLVVIGGTTIDGDGRTTAILVGLALAGTALLWPQTSRQRLQGGTNAPSAAPGPQRELWTRERRVRYWPG